MSLSSSASVAPKHDYIADLSNVPQQIFVGPGNLFGFLGEDYSGTDIFLQFYDAASTGAVTPGTDVAFTFRIPANGAMGKDAVADASLHAFTKGCVVTVSTGPASGVAPTADCIAHFWSAPLNY